MEIKQMTTEELKKEKAKLEVKKGNRGSHIPLDVALKTGAVLSAKNKSNLKEAQGLIQQVLDSAENEPRQESVEPIERLDIQELANLVLAKVHESILEVK